MVAKIGTNASEATFQEEADGVWARSYMDFAVQEMKYSLKNGLSFIFGLD